MLDTGTVAGTRVLIDSALSRLTGPTLDAEEMAEVIADVGTIMAVMAIEEGHSPSWRPGARQTLRDRKLAGADALRRKQLIHVLGILQRNWHVSVDALEIAEECGPAPIAAFQHGALTFEGSLRRV